MKLAWLEGGQDAARGTDEIGKVTLYKAFWTVVGNIDFIWGTLGGHERLQGHYQICIYGQVILTSGFPGGTVGKEATCQCRRCKRYGLNPWVWKIP